MKNLRILFLVVLLGVCGVISASFAGVRGGGKTEAFCVKYMDRAQLVADTDLAYHKLTLADEFVGRDGVRMDEGVLNGYYVMFRKSWGNVAMALALSEAAGRTVAEVGVVFDEYYGVTPDDELWRRVIDVCGAERNRPQWRKLNVVVQRQMNIWK